MSAVYKLDETDNYMKESYGISRTDLKQMLKDNDIYDIDRN
jgi:hypothetical protein